MMFRKLNPDAIARLNDPNQGMNYKSLNSGQRKYDPDTGEAYYTPSRPATLTIYGERAETVMAIIEHCETIAAALSAPQGEVERLRAALIECGRAAGAYLADDVSNDFLMLVPKEVHLRIGQLADACAPDDAALAQPKAGGE